MGEYGKYVSDKRRPIATPKSLVDENGTAVFGTFDKEFEAMPLINVKHPTRLPDIFNRLKLTLWEATEVNLKNGVLLSVVCDMGIFGKTLNVFYDKRDRKVYCWDTNLKSKDTVIAPNLIGGAVTEAHTPVSDIRYENHFERGYARLKGRHDGACAIDSDTRHLTDHSIEYDFELERVSLPCVASMPFGKNRPLYSQKDLFKVKGRLIIDGEEMIADDDSTATIDDHRGYYPRRAHYDWVATMGVNESTGEKKYFGFNLTRNQSINQEDYNENQIFLEGDRSLLPPVKFTRMIPSEEFSDYNEWTITDDHDMVNVKFKVYGQNAMLLHAIVVNIDYYIAFGELEGYVRDEDGNKYVLDGMTGIGEDKTLLL